MAKSKFNNKNKDLPYKVFLYKRVNGKTESKIFVGEKAAEKAIKEDGWVFSVSGLVDEAVKDSDLEPEQIEAIKDSADEFSRDADLLANCDKVEDIAALKEAYERLSGRKMHSRVTTIEGARNACRNLLGELETAEKSE